jgi:beta-phosphoglucomutase-like phosphatase (HAD superfamily)
VSANSPSGRPVRTVLEPLRTSIDLDRLDVAVLELETVAADLGYGDVRALSGSVTWIDHLRDEDKRIAVVDGGERGESALAIAGVADRFELTAPTFPAALEALDVPAERAVAVAASTEGVAAAVAAGFHRVIAVARGFATPEQLRRAGAHGVVAELHELL